MCDTKSLHLVSLARTGADTWHELRQALKECEGTGRLGTVRRDLEERGDLGALAFLEQVVEEAEPTPEWNAADYGPQCVEDWARLKAERT